MELGLLLLRSVGLIVAAHGAQKLFGWFGGGGPRATPASFSANFRAPLAMTLLAGGTEFFGGLAIAAGFLTSLAALGFVVVMINAIVTVHWKNGFFNQNRGFEFNLLIIIAVLTLCGTSAGKYSVDNALGLADDLSGAWWVPTVAGAAVVIAAATLVGFRKPAARPATAEAGR